MKKISITVAILFVVGVFLVFGIYMITKELTYRQIKLEIESDIQLAKKDSDCQEKDLDLIVRTLGKNLWSVSHLKLYLKIFILNDSRILRTEGCPLFISITRHYQTLLRSKGKIHGMGQWHFKGFMLILALEDKLDRNDLVKLQCYLMNQAISEIKQGIDETE